MVPDADKPPGHSDGEAATGDSAKIRPVVAVTRPDDDDRFFRMLETEGFEPIRAPLTRVRPPVDPGPLDQAVDRLAEGKGQAPGFNVLLLTSARAVRPVAERLAALGMTAPFRLRGVQIWVVGEATGAAAEGAGLKPDRMPARFVSEGLLEEAASWMDLSCARVLLPRAARGRDVLPRGLRERGARVAVVHAYRTEADPDAAARLVHLVLDRGVDAIPLTAGSAAAALARAWTQPPSEVFSARSGGRTWPDDVPLVAIGPATRARAESLGLPIRATAEPHTLAGVVAALRRVL
jgi:uroporphyrinogen-III synthase